MSGKPQILIVDDEPANLKLLGSLLAPEGFRVKVATSGEQALKLLADTLPALLLLDVVMPGMNGYEVCRSIRADTGMQDLPIVLVTGASGADDRAEGLAAGANAVLAKPVAREDLFHTLSRFGLLGAR